MLGDTEQLASGLRSAIRRAHFGGQRLSALGSSPDGAAAKVTRGLLDDARVGDPRYRSVRPIVSLVSWNEHLEGSAVEWTDEHGYGYVTVADRPFC